MRVDQIASPLQKQDVLPGVHNAPSSGFPSNPRLSEARTDRNGPTATDSMLSRVLHTRAAKRRATRSADIATSDTHMDVWNSHEDRRLSSSRVRVKDFSSSGVSVQPERQLAVPEKSYFLCRFARSQSGHRREEACKSLFVAVLASSRRAQELLRGQQLELSIFKNTSRSTRPFPSKEAAFLETRTFLWEDQALHALGVARESTLEIALEDSDHTIQ